MVKNIDFDVSGLAVEGHRAQNKPRGAKSIDFVVSGLGLEGPGAQNKKTRPEERFWQREFITLERLRV